MMLDMVLWIALTVIVLVAGIAYVVYVKMHMTTFAQIVDKSAIVDDATSWYGKLDAVFMGWKTIILGWIAAATQGLSYFLASDLSPYKDLPWEKLFCERIANWITFAIALLIPVTHALGIKTAAAVTPTTE